MRLRRAVGVTVNNGNFPHLQTAWTGYIWCRIQHSPSHHTAIVDSSSNQTTGDIPNNFEHFLQDSNGHFRTDDVRQL